VNERTRAGKLLVRYVASWPKRNGERGKATFSVGLYGENEASGSLSPLGARDCES
jgi:AP2 domain